MSATLIVHKAVHASSRRHQMLCITTPAGHEIARLTWPTPNRPALSGFRSVAHHNEAFRVLPEGEVDAEDLRPFLDEWAFAKATGLPTYACEIIARDVRTLANGDNLVVVRQLTVWKDGKSVAVGHATTHHERARGGTKAWQDRPRTICREPEWFAALRILAQAGALVNDHSLIEGGVNGRK